MTATETVHPEVTAAPARQPAPLKTSTATQRQRMETTPEVVDLRSLIDNLERRVMGQSQALAPLVDAFTRLLSGLHDPQRPLLTGLLLGPTGVGKTETVRAIGEALLGNDEAMVRINCEEYGHGHEVAKLLGSPPGYVGHQVEPLFSQANLDSGHERLLESGNQAPAAALLAKLCAGDPERRISVVLFDEIEKAHPRVWNALLGVLEEGQLTLGDNSTTDFRNTVILMTSNVGSAEMGSLLDPQHMGFAVDVPLGVSDPEALHETALAAARKNFPQEFLNRFDEVLVYSTLSEEALAGIFAKFVGDIHGRALAADTPLLLDISSAAEGWILERGTDPRYGARPLRRTVERELVAPLSRLLAAGEIGTGDVVEVEFEDQILTFYRRGREQAAAEA